MAKPSHGSLILFGIAVAIATATSAGADPRRVAAESAGRRASVPKGSSYRPSAVALAAPRSTRPASPCEDDAYAREIAEAAARYAVPERLIWAVIRVESGFDHRAVSRKGARGLMQLMPETAAKLGVRDPFDPRQNIRGGTAHLRAMMERFRHDVRLAVAAYNAGEKPVAQYRGIPPYTETRDYVMQVMRFYEGSRAPVASARGEMRVGKMRAGDVRRIVEPNGTVLYTNIAYRRPGPLASGR
jgi:soluble lytic murein transglycosylase-like protein